MHEALGEIETPFGVIYVWSYCGPEGRRESYQLTGPNGFVQFTWAEFGAISDLVLKARTKVVERKIMKELEKEHPDA